MSAPADLNLAQTARRARMRHVFGKAYRWLETQILSGTFDASTDLATMPDDYGGRVGDWAQFIGGHLLPGLEERWRVTVDPSIEIHIDEDDTVLTYHRAAPELPDAHLDEAADAAAAVDEENHDGMSERQQQRLDEEMLDHEVPLHLLPAERAHVCEGWRHLIPPSAVTWRMLGMRWLQDREREVAAEENRTG